MSMLPSKVSIVGLGKLGLCLATLLASKGFEVVGIDVNKVVVDSVNAGQSPIYEPGIQELIAASRDRLSATTNFERAILGTDVTFVIVPTPSEESGEFSLRHVTAAMGKVADALRLKKRYHLVVLTSTVVPGSIDNVVKPLLERRSGKGVGRNLGLCYSPELISLGDVIKGLSKPDFILIGESDRRSGIMLSAIRTKLCSTSPPIMHMNFVNAELAKIALNSFVTMKMSFANTLAEICEKLPGADVDTVTNAIGKDRRIGPSNLKGSLGYGGPCFPRDNVAFSQFASRTGTKAELALASHAVNLRQPSRVAKLVESESWKGAKIAIMGLTYKPKTNVLDASQAVMLAMELAGGGHQIHAYDPAVPGGHLRQLGPNIHLEHDIRDCLAKADVCIVATPLQEFERIDINLFAGKTVIDCWRILPKEVEHIARYIALGRHRRAEGDTNMRLLEVVPPPPQNP